MKTNNLQILQTSQYLLLALLQIVSATQLDEFLKSIEEVSLNLQLSRLRPKRSSSIDELLSRFDENESELDSNLEAGDAWYQSFRDMECLYGGCSKTPLQWKTKQSEPEEDYEYYEDEEPTLQDQWEQTQNDLSHEANYKLSKIEQDAVEQKLPKVAWPIRHNSKRHVDPMKAIKLKTSLRMMKNGENPTLPSSILEEDRQKISVNDILDNSRDDEDNDSWKEPYEIIANRRLLSVEDSDETQAVGERTCRTKHCLNHVIDMNQFDNIKQKTDLERKLEGITFDNIHGENKGNKKGTFATLSDQLMHSEAFVKFENFIKGQNSSLGKNKTYSDLKSTTTVSSSTTLSPLSFADKDRDVNIKLQMSVNATVLGNGKVPEKFHKNNTLNFKPQLKRKESINKGSLVDVEGIDLDRNRRRVVFPILTSTSKRKANEEISKSVVEATESFPLDEIITGKLTSQLVQTVFSLVKSSPNLKILWPGLMKNKVSSPKQVQNFYAIRNHDNESEMHRTELMLRQAMETINAIIEQQVRSRSCVPLRSDLKEFYDLILRTQAENERNHDREKRETSPEEVDNSMDDSQIRQKSRIVKKLLRDYEALPNDDQDRIANIKDNLLRVAEELKERAETSKRRKRQFIASHLLNQNSSIFLAKVPDDTQFTPQFEKLVKTAEMLLHNSLKDSDLTIDFSSI